MLLQKLTMSIVWVICSSSLTMQIYAKDQNQITSTPFSQLNWTRSKEGVDFAPLQGDRFNESYMAIVKLPAGLISPLHIKSATMYGLIVSGTMTHFAMGADPSTQIALSVGSYYKIPGGLAHRSKCVSKVDCVTFLYQDGKFDFLAVEK